jgi:hypothetical protein
MFRSEIAKGQNGPQFVVTCVTEPVERFTAGDASEAWKLAIDAANNRFGVSPANAEEDVKHRASGNILFGLHNKKVRDQLAKLENAALMRSLQRVVNPDGPVAQPFEVRLPKYVPPE